MKIYTKTGDKGQTSLFGGTKVYKDDVRINAYGTVDELNSYVGLLRDVNRRDERVKFFESIQNDLFTIASILASESQKALSIVPEIDESSVTALEEEIDKMENALEPLKNFILPGGHEYVSYCHIARTVCRRCEREVISLSKITHVNEVIIIYLNRLSDYLFVLARKMAKELNVAEVSWKGKESL